MDASQNPHLDQINALTRAVKQSKNDSQKFAALLAVSKMLNAEELTENQRKEIFLAIGFSFPIRLLTNDGDEECPKAVYNDLGLSVLTSFVSDPSLVQDPEHKKIIPVVLRLVEEKCKDTDQNSAALFDCFCYLASVAVVGYNCLMTLKQNGVRIIVNAFCSRMRDQISPMFWSILRNLISFDAETVWYSNQEHMIYLLDDIAEQSNTDFSANKFELFDQLSSVLLTLPPEYIELYCDKRWVCVLRKSLYEVLCSRISSKERNPSLRLCHHLTEICGLSWTKSEEKEKNFTALLIKLSCVEMHLIIHVWLGKKEALNQVLDSEEMATFVVCSALFEAGCTAIADFDASEDDDIFTFKDIEDLQGTLSETIEGIAQSLLPEISDVRELQDLVLSCLRTIGSWLNVQFFAASKLGLSLIETVFPAFRICLECDPSVAIKSLTPAFLHFVEIENAKKQLLGLNILTCLTAELTKQDLSDESKCLCSQCIMAFCVESQNLDEFDNILPSLMDYSLELDHSRALCFYVSLLALMIWNKRCDLSLVFPQSERFFQHIIRLLHSIHAINGSVVKVSKRFSSIWCEVEELWFILVKELIRAAQNNKDVRIHVEQSRLPNKISDLLSCKTIDRDVADNYHLFNAFLNT